MPKIDLQMLASLTEKINSKESLDKYLQNFSYYELIMLSTELSHTIENIKNNLNINQYEKIFNYIALTNNEKNILNVSLKEKTSCILETILIVCSSVIGFSSGIIGFFDAPNIALGLIYATIGIASTAMSAKTAKFSLQSLAQKAEELIEEKIIRKLQLHILIKANDKCNQEIELLIGRLTEMLAEFGLENLRNSYANFLKKCKLPIQFYQEDLYTTRRGIKEIVYKKIKKKIKNNIGLINENDVEKVYEYLKELKQVAFDATDTEASFLTEDTSQDQSVLLHRAYKDNFIVDVPESHVNFKQWYYHNSVSVKEDMIKTFLGYTAANLVLPTFIITLGFVAKAVIHVAFFGLLATALSTPPGIISILTLTVLVGIGLTATAIYKRYRSEQRKYEVEKTNKKILIQENIRGNNDVKYIKMQAIEKLFIQMSNIFKKTNKKPSIIVTEENAAVSPAPLRESFIKNHTLSLMKKTSSDVQRTNIIQKEASGDEEIREEEICELSPRLT